jgi:hypothetical protein
MSEPNGVYEEELHRMSEAGFSLSFRMLDKQGNETQITMRGATSTAWKHVLKDRAEFLEGALKSGWEPIPARQSAPQSALAGNGHGVTNGAGATPQCRIHGAMKQSKKPGSWFCPKKNADGSYCDEKFDA